MGHDVLPVIGRSVLPSSRIEDVASALVHHQIESSQSVSTPVPDVSLWLNLGRKRSVWIQGMKLQEQPVSLRPTIRHDLSFV